MSANEKHLLGVVNATKGQRSGELSILHAISECSVPQTLFELGYAYFWSKGFRAFCYVAPEAPAEPYRLMHRGMPEEWMTKYEREGLDQHDPIPGLALRHAQPIRVSQLIAQPSSLSDHEKGFLACFSTTGLSDALVFPAFGPFGRPAILSVGMPLTDDAYRELELPLAWAVAQHFHTQMSLLERGALKVRLSPRERTVLEWLAKGKSASDIATILGIASPTVSTHIQRIYEKFDVRDRVTCILKARAAHYV